MKQLLQISENLAKENEYESINLIAFLATVPKDVYNPIELELASKIFHNAIFYLCNESQEKTQTEIENLLCSSQYIELSKNERKFKFYIHDEWLYKIIILSCIRNFTFVLKSNKGNTNFVQNVILTCSNCIEITRQQTVHILRILEILIKKRKDALTVNLSHKILGHMSNVAISPLSNFKYYSFNISSMVLRNMTPSQRRNICNLKNLPIRGIETSEVLSLIDYSEIEGNLEITILKILELFSNNIDNREGGFYYEKLINCSFDNWKTNIWPLFKEHFIGIKQEGEFFQSLLKYWVPISVKQYKQDFYNFLHTENVNMLLKSYILLETRRKGYFIKELFHEDTNNYLTNFETRDVGIKIVTTYIKVSQAPDEFDTNYVKQFLRVYTNTVFNDELLKSIKTFVSQIVLVGHIVILKNSDKALLTGYVDFIQFLYQYICTSFDNKCYEVGAQILKIICSVCKGNHTKLKFSYQIDKDLQYQEENNLFYLYLKRNNFWEFDSPPFLEKLRKVGRENRVDGQNFCTLLTDVYQNSFDVGNFEDISEFLNNCTGNLQEVEKLKNLATFVIKSKGEEEEFTTLIMNLLEQSTNKLEQNNFDAKNVFSIVLYLEILIILCKHNYLSNEFHEMIVKKCFNCIDTIIDNDSYLNLDSKTSKILEHFINNTVHLLMANKKTGQNLDKKHVILHLYKIIQNSNMKKPTSLCLESLKQLLSRMNDILDDKNFKIRLLDFVLTSIYDAPMKRNLKIRKNPESRLVIHALCSSEENISKKPSLNWSLTYLIGIISDKEASNTAKTSALNCLEVLISDNILHIYALPYVEEIIMKCIQLFDTNCWTIRNADLQLVKAIIERFFGVSQGPYTRPKNIEDLFLVFPKILPKKLSNILSKEQNNTNKQIICMVLFLESQTKNSFLQVDQNLESTRNKFLSLFLTKIKTEPNFTGTVAVMSYVCLCLQQEIPPLFCEIVNFVTSNLEILNKNILKNYVNLLKELYSKYDQSLHKHENIVGLENMTIYFNDLLNLLKSKILWHHYFDLILLNVHNVDELLIYFEENTNLNNYKHRIWLHNNLPFMFNNAKNENVAIILEKILSKDIPDCVQVKILSILVKRFERNDFEAGTACEILKILLYKSHQLDDLKNNLLSIYFETILIFDTEINLEQNFIQNTYKGVKNLYKIMIYVIILSKISYDRKNESDINFLKHAVHEYIQNLTPNNESVLYEMSKTMSHLYKNMEKPMDKFHAIKIAFYLFLQECSVQQICTFICEITQTKFSNKLDCLINLLCPQNLLKHFEGDKKLVVQLLHDFRFFVNQLVDDFDSSDTFYLVQCDVSLPKQHVLKVLNSALLICAKTFR